MEITNSNMLSKKSGLKTIDSMKNECIEKNTGTKFLKAYSGTSLGILQMV